MKCAIFEEHSSSCVVYSRFSGTLFPVSMIDGDDSQTKMDTKYYVSNQALRLYTFFTLNLSEREHSTVHNN